MVENTKIKVKNAKSDKEKAKLIAELNCDVSKIKQEQIAINVSPIEGNSENSFDIIQPTHAGSKLLKDRQTDKFLILVSKKEVNDMIRQCNREKKLFSLQSSIKLSVCRAGETQVLSKNTKGSYDYIVAQDFIQEVSSELIDKLLMEIKNNISDQMARKQLFQDIIKHVSGIKLEILYKKNPKGHKDLQTIRKDRKLKKPNSYSVSKNIEIVRPKVLLEKNQCIGSARAMLGFSWVSILTTPIHVSNSGPVNSLVILYEACTPYINMALKKYPYLSLYNSNRYNDVYKFKNSDLCPECEKEHNNGKILDQYSNLYRKCSSKNFDYYEITDEISCRISRETICLLCKLGYDDKEIEELLKGSQNKPLTADKNTISKSVDSENQTSVDDDVALMNQLGLFSEEDHYKKNPLLQQKLSHLSSSFELSIGQAWANDDIWNQVMPAILTLIENLKKYAEYLITTATSMTQHHHRDESARSPENDCTMYQIDACKHDNLNDD
ncbi:hypothetical protein C1646_754604 [Rhizophagus diaphanus]|nr:hypothetical protein C1646_754604 [Rhizophagus diaphanus] [Rhizophagus sp. MUCL 43196]